MQPVVCLPQGPDRIEALDRRLRRDIGGRDFVSALEVGHDQPQFLGHDVRSPLG